MCVRVSMRVRACGRRDYRVRVCPRETHAAGGRPHAHARTHTRGHGRPALSRDTRDFAENRVCWNNLFARAAFAQRKLLSDGNPKAMVNSSFLSNTRERVLVYHGRTLARFPFRFIGKSMRLNRTWDSHISVRVSLRAVRIHETNNKYKYNVINVIYI